MSLSRSRSSSSSSSSEKPSGQCLCGAVQYTVRAGAAPYYNVLCHCANCRRATGSAFATNGIWAKDDVALTGNAAHALRAYADAATDSRTPLVRQFCARCGSPVFATTALAPDVVSVFAGTLLVDNNDNDGSGGGGDGGDASGDHIGSGDGDGIAVDVDKQREGDSRVRNQKSNRRSITTVGFYPPFKEQYIDSKKAWVPEFGHLLLSKHQRGCHT